MDLSIAIPLFNEDESLPHLMKWIEKVMQANNYSYEVIMVDDGSTDDSWEVIQALSKNNNAVKGIRFQRNYGKSAALNEAFKAAQGDVIITMKTNALYCIIFFAKCLYNFPRVIGAAIIYHYNFVAVIVCLHYFFYPFH